MLIKEDIRIDFLNLSRRLHIFIPDYINENELCDVIYMFDGHNLFLDEDATYGTSWGLMEDITKLKKKIIIVGIECNHIGNKRLEEFSPYYFKDDIYGEINGVGKEFFNWIVNDLKPYIESKYPVSKDRKHVAIGGSSMGGLMALYGLIKYSKTFSKALCLSPYIYYVHKELIKDIKRTKIVEDSEFYISFGSKETSDEKELVKYIDKLFKIQCILNTKSKIYMHIFPNHKHQETFWRKETKVWIKDLGY